MRCDHFGFAHWETFQANDHFFYGGSGHHKLGRQQHTKLGDDRGDEYCHHAGDIHVHIAKWFDKREPDGDDHLHAHSNERRWLDHVHSNPYRKRGKQTNHQLLHSPPHNYYFGHQQHTKLGYNRSNQYRHHAGDIHVHIRKWFDEREPDGDDYLHAHSN